MRSTSFDAVVCMRPSIRSPGVWRGNSNAHAPHAVAAESERANWHAHLLITTSRLEGDQFAAKKERDLGPEVRLRQAAGAGLDLEVDPTAAYAAPAHRPDPDAHNGFGDRQAPHAGSRLRSHCSCLIIEKT